MIESKIARGFSSGQKQGLEAIGFAFCIDVQPLSISQLYEDRELRPRFGYVHELIKYGFVVPIAREVAVNPKQLALPDSGNLSFTQQAQMAEEFVHQLRARPLANGTLEGVDFGMDCASVYAQLEFGYQREFGRKLFLDFARTNESDLVVGRRDIGDRLIVPGWRRDHGALHIRIVLVATPLEIVD